LTLSAAWGVVEATRSSLRAALVRQTAEAGLAFAATKGAAAATVSAKVVSLAQTALRATAMFKLKIGLIATVFVGVTALGASGLAPSKAIPMSVAPVPATAQPENPKLQVPKLLADLYGDPLPAGAANRIGSLRFRHDQPVDNVMYTPDGKDIASVTHDGVLRLWDAATGKLKWQVAGKVPEYLRNVARFDIKGNDKAIAFLSYGGFILVDRVTGKKLVEHDTPETREDRVRCLAIGPDLTTFALGFLDASVRLYDAATGQETTRAVVTKSTAINTPTITAMALGNDSKTMYVGVHEGDLKTGPCYVVRVDTRIGTVSKLPFVKDHVRYLAFSPDYRLLAALTFIGTVPAKKALVLWDIAAGEVRHSFEIIRGNPFGAIFSPDGKSIAMDTGFDVKIMDVATGTVRLQLPFGHVERALAIAPDGKTLAAGSQGAGAVTFWDLTTNTLVSPRPEPLLNYRIRFFGEDKQLLTFDFDGVSWWDVTSGKHVKGLAGGSQDLALSPDGKVIARTGGEQGASIVLFDTATNKPMRTLTGQTWERGAVTFSADSAKLFSASLEDSRILVWDVATGKLVQEIQGQPNGFVRRPAVSPDNRWLASLTDSGGPKGIMIAEVCLWDTATGKLVHRLSFPGINLEAFAFSGDGNRLVTVGGVVGPGQINNIGTVQLWDLTTGAELRRFVGHESLVSCVAITADGRMIATAGYDNTLRLWEVASGAQRAPIRGHKSRVWSVDFTQNGRLLGASSMDAPVYIWDIYALQKPQLLGVKLLKEEQVQLWQSLADTDATKAFQAICELVARPTEAVPILETGWKTLPRVSTQQMQKWIEDLDSAQFSVRDKAAAEIKTYGAAHEVLLRQARDKAPSLELRRRLDSILERQDPEKLRRTRMLEVLERIGTGSARRFLQELAGQSEDGALAQEAAWGLKRMLH
jgi:WD40 repeat protein